MEVGSVPADWRANRVAVRVITPARGQAGAGRYLDVDHPATHECLTSRFAASLAQLGVPVLDTSLVRGPDRRITQLIAAWASSATDEHGSQLFDGLRYSSRFGGWACCALFEDTPITVVEQRPITTDMSELQRVATLFHLTVH